MNTEVSLKIVLLHFVQVAFPCSPTTKGIDTSSSIHGSRQGHGYVPNVLFSIVVDLVMGLLPQFPVLVECHIGSQCTGQSERENGENRHGVHLHSQGRQERGEEKTVFLSFENAKLSVLFISCLPSFLFKWNRMRFYRLISSGFILSLIFFRMCARAIISHGEAPCHFAQAWSSCMDHYSHCYYLFRALHRVSEKKTPDNDKADSMSMLA